NSSDAEMMDVGFPRLCGEERELGHPDGRKGLDGEEQTDGGEHQQHHDGAGPVEPEEDAIARSGNSLDVTSGPVVRFTAMSDLCHGRGHLRYRPATDGSGASWPAEGSDAGDVLPDGGHVHLGGGGLRGR